MTVRFWRSWNRPNLVVPALCREHGMSNATFYKWRSKYGGMDASLMKRVKELEDENRRLKKMYADERLKAEMVQEALAKKWWGRLGAKRWPRRQRRHMALLLAWSASHSASAKAATAISRYYRMKMWRLLTVLFAWRITRKTGGLDFVETICVTSDAMNGTISVFIAYTATWS